MLGDVRERERSTYDVILPKGSVERDREIVHMNMDSFFFLKVFFHSFIWERNCLPKIVIFYAIIWLDYFLAVKEIFVKITRKKVASTVQRNAKKDIS